MSLRRIFIIRSSFPFLMSSRQGNRRMTHAPAMSWYGKLPVSAIFTTSISGRTASGRNGFGGAVGTATGATAASGERQFSNAPVWNFIVPPMLRSDGQIKCRWVSIPGRDRWAASIRATNGLQPAGWSRPISTQVAENGRQRWATKTLLHATQWLSAEQLDERYSPFSFAGRDGKAFGKYST